MRHETFYDNHIGSYCSGRTSIAAALAARINSLDAASWGGNTQGAEIISVIVARCIVAWTLRTGKNLEDYTIDGKQIPYHLIDICEPG